MSEIIEIEFRPEDEGVTWIKREIHFYNKIPAEVNVAAAKETTKLNSNEVCPTTSPQPEEYIENATDKGSDKKNATNKIKVYVKNPARLNHLVNKSTTDVQRKVEEVSTKHTVDTLIQSPRALEIEKELSEIKTKLKQGVLSANEKNLISEKLKKLETELCENSFSAADNISVKLNQLEWCTRKLKKIRSTETERLEKIEVASEVSKRQLKHDKKAGSICFSCKNYDTNKNVCIIMGANRGFQTDCLLYKLNT